MTLYAFQNDHFRPLNEIAISFDDAGFIWGAVVVDRCRTYGQLPFRLEDHLARFERSCKLAHVALRIQQPELKNIVTELLLRNQSVIAGNVDAFIVFVATPGPADRHAPTLLVYPELLEPARYAPIVQKGAHLVTVHVRAVDPASIAPQIKHRSRLHWWLAEHQARAQAADAMALLSDAQGRLTETATANLLLVLDGVLCSPPRPLILPGVSLRVVEELCQTAKVRFEERALAIGDVAEASEALVSSTPFGLAPVRRIDDRAFAVPGPVFGQLCAAWRRQLGFDPHAEFLRATGSATTK
jgi:branched-chain amino acid aminotransferase